VGKKNNSYTASYKVKVISFAEQFGNRAAERELGILESSVRFWRKQKKKSAYFTHPDFSAAKMKKKSAQITRVNTVNSLLIFGCFAVHNGQKELSNMRHIASQLSLRN